MIKQSFVSLEMKYKLIMGVAGVVFLGMIFFLTKGVFFNVFTSPGRFVSFVSNGVNDIIPIAFVLILFAVIYFCLYKTHIEMYILFAVGAVLSVFIGSYLNFYSNYQAWEILMSRIEVFVFIISLNIITAVLDEAGLFLYLTKKILSGVGTGDKIKLLLLLCVFTYVLSLFVNNLTTVMVVFPIVFYISKHLKASPVPFIVGIIIASNLGGASTMIGDFPNILIGTEAHLKFFEFIVYMMPVCLIGLLALLIYLWMDQQTVLGKLPGFISKERKEELAVFMEELKLQSGNVRTPGNITVVRADNSPLFKNEGVAKRGLLILGAVIFGFLISDMVGIPPVAIVAAGGLAALFFCGVKAGVIFERLDYKSLVFFASLFVLVGATQLSGLLDLLGGVITALSFGNVLLQCILVMWLAAVITAFCNAGPATAIFMPVVMSIQTAASPHNIFWWALSLGVLAGSSATITGATAGAVSSSMLSEYSGKPLTFGSYLKIGLPISIIILLISTGYIVLLYVF